MVSILFLVGFLFTFVKYQFYKTFNQVYTEQTFHSTMCKNSLKSFENLEKSVKIISLHTSSVETKAPKNLKIGIYIGYDMFFQRVFHKNI